MRFFADLHIHSRFSRATSRDMTPETLWEWAQIKGISLIGTGDITHPGWIKELHEKLHPEGNGLFTLSKEFQHKEIPESCKADVFFMLTAEICCIYRKRDRARKIHLLLLVPDFNDASRINASLWKIGRLDTDGRPVLGVDAKKLLEMILNEAPESMVIPAHLWTPHFSLLGANSGFDSIKECFEELTPHIHAVETGLSSDPPMNHRLSALDNLALISNSDAHSPSKIGREANLFNCPISYTDIIQALRGKGGPKATIEFFPQEGKYYYDGHRQCSVSWSPQETLQNNYLCPSCGNKVTVGVMHRINKLADREEGFKSKHTQSCYWTIPLQDIISEALRTGINSKSAQREYSRLLGALGSELRILIETPLEDINRQGTALLGEAISRVRSGDVKITPGYDGEYGTIKILD